MKSLARKLSLFFAGVVLLTCIILIGSTMFLFQKIETKMEEVLYENTLESYKTEVKSEVQSAVSIVAYYYDLSKSGKLSELTAQRQALEALRNLRYGDDGSGYFWVDGTDYTLIMHPILPDQEGTNRYDLTDQNGVKIIQNIMKSAEDGGGFNEFYFTKSDGVTVAPKTAYSESFPEWNWVITTGIYSDDIEGIVSSSDGIQEIISIFGNSSVTLIILGIVLALIMLLVSYFVILKLVQMINKVKDNLHAVSEGDLTSTLDKKYESRKDELGQMISHTNHALNTLRGSIATAKDTAATVDKNSTHIKSMTETALDATSQVAQTIEQVASDTTRQAGAISDVVEHISNMSADTENMNVSLDNIGEYVSKLSSDSTQMKEKLELMSKGSALMTSQVSGIADKIEETNTSIQQMSDILDAIQEIAEQTNLLALNASIEAARAGEAGKGFAVVADQIRTLSTETHASSGQIREALSRLDATSAKMTASIEETLKLIQITLEKVTQTGDNVNQIASDSAQLGNHIQVVDNAIKEVESSNTQLVSNMEQVSNIVETITGCIAHSSQTSERMLSKYEETADNINTIEDVMENMMCDLGIGGFMGIEDMQPGMKIGLQLVGQGDTEYLGELISQIPEGLLVSCQKKLTITDPAPCLLQITAGNILYCWDKATIAPDPDDGAHVFRITITTRPRINNRRKYPRMDLGNACTIRFKNSDKEYSATMDNISANGFAFLATDRIFAQSKDADLIVTIHDFALPNHNELEGRIIRCSDDNGLYIVGCQMPEDNFYILEYVEKNLEK